MMPGWPGAQPVAAPPRMCPGCGANAPSQQSACTLCSTPFGAAMLPAPIDGVHFVQVRLQATCLQCNQKSPVDSLAADGRFYCVHCGRDALFVQDAWQETVLPFASAVGDCFWARLGVFPPWPASIPDRDFFDDAGDPWSEHAEVLPTSLRDNFPMIGVDRPRLRITMSGMTMGSAGMRSRGLEIELSPGHPLCGKCRTPAMVSGAGAGLATVRCAGCRTEETYRVPEHALGWCEELVGVIAPDHVQGRSEVRIEAQAGNAAVAVKCPSCGSPLALAPDERFATCPYCKTQSIVPVGVLAQAFRKPTPPRPWWLAMRSPSALRGLLGVAQAGARGGILVVPPGSSVGEIVPVPNRGDGGRSGANVGMSIGLVGGGVALAGGLGAVLFTSSSSHDDPASAPQPAAAPKRAAAPAAPTAAPVAGCSCASGDGMRQTRIEAHLLHKGHGAANAWELSVTSHPAGQPYVSMSGTASLETHDGTVPPSTVGPTLHMGMACDPGVVVFAYGRQVDAWSTANEHLAWTAQLPAPVADSAGGAGIACFPLAVDASDAVTVPLAGGRHVSVSLVNGKIR